MAISVQRFFDKLRMTLITNRNIIGGSPPMMIYSMLDVHVFTLSLGHLHLRLLLLILVVLALLEFFLGG